MSFDKKFDSVFKAGNWDEAAELIREFKEQDSNVKIIVISDPDNISNLEKIPQLTDRETDVLRLIVDGHNNAEISRKLCVSIHTAKAHVCSILHKLNVEDRTQAAILALKNRII